MNLIKFLVEKFFYTDDDLSCLSGINLLGKNENYLITNYYKKLSYDSKKQYYTYIKTSYGISWLIYIRNNKIVEIYLRSHKLKMDQFNLVQENHLKEVEKYRLVEKFEKPSYSTYNLYENDIYQIVIDKNIIVVRDFLNQIK